MLPKIMSSNCNAGDYKGKVEDAIKEYLKERYKNSGGEYTEDSEVLDFCDFKSFKELRTKDKLNKYIK